MDAPFYLHELAERNLMGKGLAYEEAHAAALQKYGVSPFSVYAAEVVADLAVQFNNNWRAFQEAFMATGK